MARSYALSVVKFVGNPGAPTVTPQGAAGSTAYSYLWVAKDSAGNASAAGAVGSTATGNATLSGANFNRNTISPVPNAASYDVYRTAGGATQGKIASGITGTTFDDVGIVADGTTAPAANNTGIGSQTDCSTDKEIWVQVDGTFVATLQLEGQINGAAGWVAIGAPQTAPGFLQIPQSLNQLRAHMTAYTSGAPVVVVCAHGRA